MFKKLFNLENRTVYSKDVERHDTVTGFWESNNTKVIVLVKEFDVTDRQKCSETFGALDFNFTRMSDLLNSGLTESDVDFERSGWHILNKDF